MDVTTNYNGANNVAVKDRPAQVSVRPAMQRPTAQRLTEAQISQIVVASTTGTRIQEQDFQGLPQRSQTREESITDAMMDQAFEDANRVLAGGQFRLSYSEHEATGRIMVTVYSANSDEVLREIPAESRLDIYARITEFVGLMFDQGN